MGTIKDYSYTEAAPTKGGTEYDGMMRSLLDIFPDAMVDEISREIVVFTGMETNKKGEVFPIEKYRLATRTQWKGEAKPNE